MSENCSERAKQLIQELLEADLHQFRPARINLEGYIASLEEKDRLITVLAKAFKAAFMVDRWGIFFRTYGEVPQEIPPRVLPLVRKAHAALELAKQEASAALEKEGK